MIVAQAGRKGAVTVATNMAGRGVDILLGGNPEYLARQEMAARDFDNDRYLLFEMDEEERAAYEAEYEPIFTKLKEQTDAEHDEVVELGGLYVLGTERHESRRIDNQLRGRSGRQGDPGASLFYLSLEDDLMRMFASDRVASIMNRLKWPDDEPIEAKMVSRAVENAQKQIEELNYERRKNVLKYDEVMNGQREVIYGERRKILEGHDLKEQALGFVEEVVARCRRRLVPADVFPEEWDRDGADGRARRDLPGAGHRQQAWQTRVPPRSWSGSWRTHSRRTRRRSGRRAEVMRELERIVLLNITDTKWREHLYEMDYLQEGIHLRAYAQQDPITEYRREAFDDVRGAAASIQEDFVRYIYRVELVRQDEQQAPAAPQPQRVQENRDEVERAGGRGSSAARRHAATRTRRSATRCRATRPARAAAGRSTRSATAPPCDWAPMGLGHWPTVSHGRGIARPARSRLERLVPHA